MSNKKILTVVIAVLVLGVAYVYINNTKQHAVSPETNSIATFTNPDSKESVSVVFKEETAVLTGLGYTNLILDIQRAASGARYVHELQNLELWNRGDEVTISKDGQQIFFGNVGGQTDVDRLTSSTWVWQATTIGDVVTEPKDATAFNLTFDATQGTISATTDCNTIFGPYTVGADNAFTFGALAMTKKFCEGSQENDFAEGLSKVTSFTFNGSGALVFEFASGTGSMLFGKK